MTRMTSTNNTVPDGRSKPASTWHNAKDGHTYWLDGDGDLLAAPTLVNGEVDWDSFVYVDDFAESLTQLEKASIIVRLGAPMNSERPA
jgi:hypothetical protein